MKSISSYADFLKPYLIQGNGMRCLVERPKDNMINYWKPAVSSERWSGILLNIREASPFMRVREILGVRLAAASFSRYPVRRDGALPSLLSCSTSTEWRPPRDSAKQYIAVRCLDVF